MIDKKARLVAYYLPQFHPIPENDRWWGKGFTEWTNVAKAKPLFPAHYQPHLPADLGFYDLRVPETRIAQADMAQSFGIEGFCYWHYWFAGKRILERPLNEVLQSGSPDYPFCLAWANQTWTGIWHGAPNRILIEQTYPGIVDHEAHFYAVLNCFTDHRYITVDDMPLFIIYDPYNFPDPKRFCDLWRELAINAGLKGIFLAAQIDGRKWAFDESGFDAAITDTLTVIQKNMNGYYEGVLGYAGLMATNIKNRIGRRYKLKSLVKPTIYDYEQVIKAALPKLETDFEHYPCVIPNWDNTPRSGTNGLVFRNSTPKLFKKHLQEAIDQVQHKEYEKRLVFIKSWNEWAEGNYLEPDMHYGKSYLKVINEVNKEGMVENNHKVTQKNESYI